MIGAALGVVALASGCTTSCGRNSECPSGQVCTAQGFCAVPPDAAEGASSDAAASALGEAAVRTDAIDSAHGVHGVP
jgi:hypothetical protein